MTTSSTTSSPTSSPKTLKIIREYINLLQSNFELGDLTDDELFAIWLEKYPARETSPAPPAPTTSADAMKQSELDNTDEKGEKHSQSDPLEMFAAIALSESDLLALKKDALVQMCKEAKVAYSGSKAQLVANLLAPKIDTPPKEKSTKSRVKKQKDETKSAEKSAKSKTKKKSKKPLDTDSLVIRELLESVPELQVQRNQFGNYEDEATSFVFDPVSAMVIAKQSPDGLLLGLTLDDVNQCMEMHYPYKLPPNLDAE